MVQAKITKESTDAVKLEPTHEDTKVSPASTYSPSLQKAKYSLQQDKVPQPPIAHKTSQAEIATETTREIAVMPIAINTTLAPALPYELTPKAPKSKHIEPIKYLEINEPESPQKQPSIAEPAVKNIDKMAKTPELEAESNSTIDVKPSNVLIAQIPIIEAPILAKLEPVEIPPQDLDALLDLDIIGHSIVSVIAADKLYEVLDLEELTNPGITYELEALDNSNETTDETGAVFEMMAEAEIELGAAVEADTEAELIIEIATNTVEFTALFDATVEEDIKPNLVEILVVTEAAPLPPICIEVMLAIHEIAPDQATIAQEMLQIISSTIDLVIEQRNIRDESAPLTEQTLEMQCIELLGYLQIAYTPEIIMELVAGIIQAKQTTKAAAKQVELTLDLGTREATKAARDNNGFLRQIRGVLAKALGKISLNNSSFALTG